MTCCEKSSSATAVKNSLQQREKFSIKTLLNLREEKLKFKIENTNLKFTNSKLKIKNVEK